MKNETKVNSNKIGNFVSGLILLFLIGTSLESYGATSCSSIIGEDLKKPVRSSNAVKSTTATIGLKEGAVSPEEQLMSSASQVSIEDSYDDFFELNSDF